MPGLNRHSKLITPGGVLFLVVVGTVWSIWFWEIDYVTHLRGMGDTVRKLLHAFGL